ncbi:MAG TPA: homocysteine S-methyltransferase family protein [Chthoniobacteraceae bacterium]|nr:homocysteine S-methyltransferase family protein [Chthoniobacteraceae bacterium]
MKASVLPHLTDRPYVTDGGLETTLVFHENIDLPCFAAFDLLRTPAGRETLREYYRTYANFAREFRVGFILESPTWRANPDWAQKLGYTKAGLVDANRNAIALMHEVRAEFETPETPVVVSGCLGPRGDGYQPSALMSAREAAAYHRPQIRTYRDEGVDLVTAFTLNYAEEAIGIADAAADLGIPAVISFTTETDGKLPTGQGLGEAIEAVDAAASQMPAYYMINCAHPTHLRDALPTGAPWLKRIRGLRANASCRSHAELDESPDLDSGNPQELAGQYRQLRRKLTNLQILGGCCGTDHRHVEAICQSCFSPAEALIS